MSQQSPEQAPEPGSPPFGAGPSPYSPDLSPYQPDLSPYQPDFLPHSPDPSPYAQSPYGQQPDLPSEPPPLPTQTQNPYSEPPPLPTQTQNPYSEPPPLPTQTQNPYSEPPPLPTQTQNPYSEPPPQTQNPYSQVAPAGQVYGEPQYWGPNMPLVAVAKPPVSPAMGIIGFSLATVALVIASICGFLGGAHAGDLYLLYGDNQTLISENETVANYVLGVFACSLPGVAGLTISIIATVRKSSRPLAILGIVLGVLGPLVPLLVFILSMMAVIS